jgi:CDP-diacylglycerol---serine O-phosphatidyltransferase
MDNPQYENASQASRIYFLPNLMTAGNLFCGFAAIMRCVEAKFAARIEVLDPLSSAIVKSPAQLYEQAIWFILAGVVFDSLDGRLARLGGQESLFGKEFDSLADIVTFGIAPALLVMFMLLSPTQDYPIYRLLGWVVSFFYLACSAIRLARFNVITSPLLKPDERLPKYDFLGLPIPAAAGTVASIVMVMNQLVVDNSLPDSLIPTVTFILPPVLLFIALLMVSTVHYPSFKHIDWKTRIKVGSLVLLSALIFLIYQFHYYTIAFLFMSYLLFGIIRHVWRLRKGAATSPIEEDDD